MICVQCRRRLKVDATSCMCGWTLSRSTVVHDHAEIEREREEIAAREARWQAAGCPPAADSIARMHFIQKQPKPTPAEHWRRVAAMKNPPAMAYQHAIAYLTRIGEYTEREPGQDDDEREAA